MAETPEEFFARVSAAADAEGRLIMPDVAAWDTFPFDGELRVRPLCPPTTAEPVRGGEEPGSECWGCLHGAEKAIWSDDNWLLLPIDDSGLPVVVILEPREHLDFRELNGELAAELGPMLVRVERAIHAVGEIGRVHMNKWGDGSYHAHIWFFGRPARLPQLIGSFTSIWYDVLPALPDKLRRENLCTVAHAMATGGGTAHV
jgi:diadenosine tetraphosphate (Ap4A) HIT family hydrolase